MRSKILKITGGELFINQASLKIDAREHRIGAPRLYGRFHNVPFNMESPYGYKRNPLRNLLNFMNRMGIK